MKKIIVFLYCILLACNIFAQYTFKGRVELDRNKKEFTFAYAKVEDLDMNVDIDLRGEFSIILPKGVHTIVFSANNYKPISIKVHESLEGDVEGVVFLGRSNKMKERSRWIPFYDELSPIYLGMSIMGYSYNDDNTGYYRSCSIEELYNRAYKFYYREDYEIAAIFSKLAADKGHPKAQYLLGMLFSEGKGVSVAKQQADVWLKKAAENGCELGADNRLHIKQYVASTPTKESSNIIPKGDSNETKQPVNNNQLLAPSSQRRIALVLGNSDYPKGRLANPVYDVKDVGKKLSSLGFKTTVRINEQKGTMKGDISQFCKDAKLYDIILFYYAGHALQNEGNNYLFPINSEIETPADIEDQCVSLNWIIKKMYESGVKTKIIVLDACRDNPVINTWDRGITPEGLSEIRSVPEGTFLVYSAQAGKKAKDGIGKRNSPFATAFLKVLDEPMLSLHEVFHRVKNIVADETNREQIPQQVDSYLGDFYFNIKK